MAIIGDSLCSYPDYHYFFVYGGESARQLDRFFHETLPVAVFGRGQQFVVCHVAQYVCHCFHRRIGVGGSGQSGCHRDFNLRHKTRNTVLFLNNIPILNPEIITGVSLFLLFVSLGISQGFMTVVLAHISFCVPYVVLSILPRLKQMNPSLYEAALDLGATPMQALRKVIFPEIKPGIISGFILTFTLSFDDFVVSLFTIGNEGLQTLSTYIYADARKGGLTPELRPLTSLIFIVVLVLLFIVNQRAKKSAVHEK